MADSQLKMIISNLTKVVSTIYMINTYSTITMCGHLPSRLKLYPYHLQQVRVLHQVAWSTQGVCRDHAWGWGLVWSSCLSSPSSRVGETSQRCSIMTVYVTVFSPGSGCEFLLYGGGGGIPWRMCMETGR